MSATTGGRRTRLALAVALAAAAVGVVALGGPSQPQRRAPGRAASAAATPVAPGCRFEPGETAAFRLESTVRDVRGEAADHLRGTLSWQVVEQLPAARWRLRAALTDVSLSQTLTLPDERARGPLTDPFFVDVDAACRFVGFGFARDWDARRRQLVKTTLLTHEFVLPAARSSAWRATQSDGLGPFEASYAMRSTTRGPALHIERRKAAYDGQGAAALGLAIVVLGSQASASFDRERPAWMTATSGLERVQVRVQGEVAADLIQRFSLTRDDARFVAMRAVAATDADFRDAFDLEVERDQIVDARMAQTTYEDALQALLDRFDGTTGDPSYAAARELAAWLKSHPEAAQRLVADLGAGAIAEAARPALFLGLELSGTDAARDALSEVLTDPRFRGLDRARAASALSDIGGPTRDTAELLLAQARDDGDAMVASVSLLGLGKLARRSDDAELRTYVRDSLDRELAAAADDGTTHLVLDAMGNSGDPAFAEELGTHLAAESAATRQHAAEALGRLDPAEGGPRLLDRLAHESDPGVSAAMVAAYHGPATADAITLMSDKLAASTSLPERAAIIGWLGSASRTRPEARSQLVAHFQRETDARLVQQIGAFVPAAALR